MKTSILSALCLLVLSSAAYADSGTNEPDQECLKESKDILVSKLGKPLSKITFFNGALLGDGANAIQISMFHVIGLPGLYKVELDAEDCLLRNIELVNN